MTMKETWAAIPGWPTYEASDLGRVRRISGGRWGRSGNVLRARKNSNGYLRVQLRHNDRQRYASVHSLVLETFVGPRPLPHFHGAHLDGNKGNNLLGNLDWVSPAENLAHKELHGTVARGERSHLAKLTDALVLEARQRRSRGETTVAIARALGVSQSAISNAVTGKTWSHIA